MKRYLLILGLGAFLLTSCATRVVTTTPAASSKVVVIKKAPRNHKVVVVNGKRYYRWNGNHYRKTRNGYVLVKLR
ncbi:MAG: hypothetical protein KJO05_12565 [Bacteroidia bacterium]|nr:hypothetical protein [Bacteroidia bacterium]NNF32138.1 hypothetical protein [Flavobacteriaceae bacterium]MBT8274651.1 hypothetical protein [Bacteroidia bacterium]NNJ82747.1 hypothetical protein [Flavobacteriaceae bacterium]NNK55657.1 hypothetical protein [Flavobacteriaceae bacterium]